MRDRDMKIEFVQIKLLITCVRIKLFITYLLGYWLYVLKKVHLIINIEKYLLFKKVTDVLSGIFWETKSFLNS